MVDSYKIHHHSSRNKKDPSGSFLFMQLEEFLHYLHLALFFGEHQGQQLRVQVRQVQQ
jgi:hypothetical protein